MTNVISNPNDAILWHYTLGELMPYYIKTHHIPISPTRDRKVLKSCCFSLCQDWEPIAHCLKRINGQECLVTKEILRNIGGGLYRIGVEQDTAPVTWTRFLLTSGIGIQEATHIGKMARLVRADTDNWRFSYEAVHMDKWLVIEMWTEAGWQEIDGDVIEEIMRVDEEKLNEIHRD